MINSWDYCESLGIDEAKTFLSFSERNEDSATIQADHVPMSTRLSVELERETYLGQALGGKANSIRTSQ